MDEVPLFTVILCTHNRVAYLRQALNGLRQQTMPSELFEVLVVDNLSTDDTAQFMQAEQLQAENVRYCFEEELGLSAARNRGLREANGKYLAFLDDDAVPIAEWLQAAKETFERHDETLGMLGGKVVPIWGRERPHWLSDNLVGYLSMVDLGDEEQEVYGTAGIVGANMMFPKKILEELGGFPTKLGRKGSNLLSNEELALKKSLHDAGYRSIYHPKVMVYHHAPAERLQKHWFLRRQYWQGQSDSVWWQLQNHPSKVKKFRYASQELLQTAKAIADVLLKLSATPATRFNSQTWAAYHFGAFLGTFRRPTR